MVYTVFMRERVLEGAGHLFMQYGVRSVTMDDIASYLSVSKKTIYQYFKDKDEVVTLTTNFLINKDKQEFEGIHNQAENAIEELYMVSKCLRRMVDDINPSLLFDLQKYHHSAWQVYLEYKEKFIFDMVVDNLRKGIADGHFRDDIDTLTLARLRVEEVQLSFDNKIFPRDKYDFRQVQMQLFNHFVYGIVTEEGRRLYEEYLKNNN